MLDETSPDVLAICTPSGAHLEPTLTAAERGVHVLCEKPLGITTARIDEMIAACEEAGIRLDGIFHPRYNPVVETMYDMVMEGRSDSLRSRMLMCRSGAQTTTTREYDKEPKDSMAAVR